LLLAPVAVQNIAIGVFAYKRLLEKKNISNNRYPNFSIFVHVAYDRGSVILRWHCSTLSTSIFEDDVMFAKSESA